MLNLHKIMPDHFAEDEFVFVDLDALYKKHSPHSHEAALEVIFAEGVLYSDDTGDHNASEIEALKQRLVAAENRHKAEFVELLDKHDELKNKYETLLTKINATSIEVESNSEVQQKVVAQTLDMGKALR